MANIIKLSNQGFCYGIKRAIQIAVDARNDPTVRKPIYLLGNLAHNMLLTKALEQYGIITIEGDNRLEMLDSIPNGSSVILSAHGVSDKVRKKALSKNLWVIDATCPYVGATFSLVDETIKEGNEILFVGRANHPETEAVLELSHHAHLYNPSCPLKEELVDKNICVAYQTTMSVYDMKNIFEDIKRVYPNATIMDMICRATEKRQKEVESISYQDNDLIIVVGDVRSNNSTKLYEMALRVSHKNSIFIDSVSDLKLSDLKKYNNIYVASGTSTPNAVVDEIVNTLNNLDNINSPRVESNISVDDIINKENC